MLSMKHDYLCLNINLLSSLMIGKKVDAFRYIIICFHIHIELIFY